MNKWVYIIVIIICIIIIIGISLFLKEYSKCYFVEANTAITDKIETTQGDLIDNFVTEELSDELLIIPHYKNPTTAILSLYNFGTKPYEKRVLINGTIEKTLTFPKGRTQVEISDDRFNFVKKLSQPSLIPKRIVQTGEDRFVSQNKALTTETIKEWNPDYVYTYYDKDARVEFIQRHFGERVLAAYHSLKPGAYKADIFRYCYMYIVGGVYIDSKMICLSSIDDIIQGDYELVLAEDIPSCYSVLWCSKDKGFCNGIMFAVPGLQLFKDCIDLVVNNIEAKLYSESPHHVTGPPVLYKAVEKYLPVLKHKILPTPWKMKKPRICEKDSSKPVFNMMFPNYYYENCYIYKKSYGLYWLLKQIYN